MNNPYLSEYIELISESNAYFDIQEGVIYLQGEEVKEIDVQKRYNGFNSVERYEAKLKALSSLLKPDVKLQQLGHHQLGNSILGDLKSLLSKFIQCDRGIVHINFKLKKAERVENLLITQNHFSPFIESAYENLCLLLNVPEVEFRRIFSGGNSEYDYHFVNNALRDLKIVNNDGESSLRKRSIGILWAFIDVLVENKVIIRKTEEQLMRSFWIYTKGVGKAPMKPHRNDSKSFKSVLKKVEEYFLSNYSPPNCDN